MDKHTPTPWLNTRTDSTMRDRYSQPFAILQEGNANLVAGCFGDVAGGEEVAEANAAFIVEAVNSYDTNLATIEALVGALEDARSAIATCPDDTWSSVQGENEYGDLIEWPFRRELLSKIDSALRLARGGA